MRAVDRDPRERQNTQRFTCDWSPIAECNRSQFPVHAPYFLGAPKVQSAWRALLGQEAENQQAATALQTDLVHS